MHDTSFSRTLCQYITARAHTFKMLLLLLLGPTLKTALMEMCGHVRMWKYRLWGSIVGVVLRVTTCQSGIYL